MFICCRLTTDWLLLAVQVCNTLWFVYILCSEVKHVGMLTRACQNLFIFLFAVPGTLTQPLCQDDPWYLGWTYSIRYGA